MPLASQEHISATLYAEIKLFCKNLINAHYFEEANWVWMATSAPDLSLASPVGRAALYAARQIAWEFASRNVAEWISVLLQRSAITK